MLKSPEKEVLLNQAVTEFLSELTENNFFGIIELHYQNGRIVRLKKHEVLEPKDLIDGQLD